MLATRVNMDGARSFRLSGDYSLYSWALLSNIRLRAIYGSRQTPSFFDGEPTVIVSERYVGTVHWTGNFSSAFVPSLRASSTYSYRDNDIVRNAWFSQTLALNLQTLLLKSIELSATNDLNWDVNWPNVPGMDRFGVVSSLTGAYLFDEQGDLKLRVDVNDLLNRRQQIRVSVADEFIARAYAYTLGRHVMLRLQYKF